MIGIARPKRPARKSGARNVMRQGAERARGPPERASVKRAPWKLPSSAARAELLARGGGPRALSSPRSSHPHQPLAPAQVLEQREVQRLGGIEQRIVYAGVHPQSRQRGHVLPHQLAVALALLERHHRDAVAALEV